MLGPQKGGIIPDLEREAQFQCGATWGWGVAGQNSMMGWGLATENVTCLEYHAHTPLGEELTPMIF